MSRKEVGFMKKLISVKDVECAHGHGLSVIQVEESTIITAAAKELADTYKIKFSTETVACTTCEESTSSNANGLDGETIYNLLSKMMNNGLIDESICENPAAVFKADCAPNGTKVVCGKSVKMEEFDTGTPGAKVAFQELVNKNESQMSAGFLTIDESKFDWKLTYEEVDYVIEGTVQITIDGKVLTAHKGDVIYVPSGSDVNWASPDNAKLFFVTYPANWADLL